MTKETPVMRLLAAAYHEISAEAVIIPEADLEAWRRVELAAARYFGDYKARNAERRKKWQTLYNEGEAQPKKKDKP